MTVKTTRVLSCDAGCGAEFQAAAMYADEWSIAAAEAGWHQFKAMHRMPGRNARSRDVYVCPDCPPRTAADKVRADLAAEEAERTTALRAQYSQYSELAELQREADAIMAGDSDGDQQTQARS